MSDIFLLNAPAVVGVLFNCFSCLVLLAQQHLAFKLQYLFFQRHDLLVSLVELPHHLGNLDLLRSLCLLDYKPGDLARLLAKFADDLILQHFNLALVARSHTLIVLFHLICLAVVQTL